MMMIIIINVFLERLSMWNMLNCAEQVQMISIWGNHTGRTTLPSKYRPSWLQGKTLTWGRYHGGRRLSSDDSLHSPTVIPPSALDKLSITKRYHRWRTTRWGVTARSPTMVTKARVASYTGLDGNASWYSVCRVPMVEWRLDCENFRHLTVVGLHDTGPWCKTRPPWYRPLV